MPCFFNSSKPKSSTGAPLSGNWDCPHRGDLLDDIESWIQMGVLPYLDLTLWAYLNDLNVPNRVMADAIYSDGEGNPNRVRKVTKVWADDLTRSEHAGSMRQLKVQAALEISKSVNAE